MNKKHLPLLFLLLSFLGLNLFSQEKWSVDPRSTQIYPSGQYVPLPQVRDNYVNPNHEVRVVKTPQGTFLVNPNFRVHPENGATQSEVILTRDQQIPNVMFGSANTVWPPGGFSGISEGVYVTTDGGTTWFGFDTVHSPVISGHGGDPGVAIDKNSTLIISHLGYPTSGMFANYSTDFGTTFSATYTIATGSQDKNLSGTDDAPSSAFYGRTYTVWSWFSVASPYIAISYTTNSGVSWSSPAQVNTPPAGHYSQGVDVRVGPSGQVYLTWAAPSSSTLTEDFDGFAVSTNGGVNFTVTENAIDANGIRGTLATKNNIRVNSFPRIDVDRTGGPRNGWIYIVGDDKNLSPAGSDPDVILHRSTDGGVTWSSGIRVNQDALNNGAIQYFPAIRVDEFGGLNVVYYDDRNVGGNQVQVFVSRSLDGGNTWTDIQVSDHAFTPAPISGLAGGYQGDYIGITSNSNKVWPFWMDNSSGIYQAWTTSIDLGPGITHTPLPNTESLTGPYAVNCVITPANSPIDPTKTKVFWSRNNPNITDSVLMTNTSGNNWTANIPGNGSAATYRYYINTADMLGRRATAPAGAPASLYSFLAQVSTTPPVITHTPLPNWPKPNWPATVAATVTDQIGVDSSWVEWNINHGAGKEFKLQHTSGINYSAAFNSVISDVNIGDSIFYVVKARSSGVNHLVGVLPLTGIFGFKIIDVFLCENFEGSSFPPAGWTITGGTANYWKQGSVSAFGQGAKSTYYNMWTAPNGENENFNTLTFGATGAHDTLVYDYAFAPYPASPPFDQDSLVILTSTDGGSTYTSLARYGPLEDSTHVALSSEFVPTAADWRIRRLVLPAGTNKVDLFGKSAFGNDLYIDNVCVSAGTLTGITINNSLPFAYSLSQNFPNPFNPSTVIKYAIPRAGIVKMVVYDILGRQVALLVNELKQPGNYEVKFDALNFASGVYFYKIEAGDFTSVKKMLLLK